MGGDSLMKKLLLLLILTLSVVLSGCAGTVSAAGTDGIDIDFTQLSANLVYAEVYNIMQAPEDYIGKTLKIDGLYYASYYDVTDQFYHFILIEDALACCQQGLEFKWSGGHEYPADYPDELAEIQLVGTFDDYVEDGTTYYYLSVEDIAA